MEKHDICWCLIELYLFDTKIRCQNWAALANLNPGKGKPKYPFLGLPVSVNWFATVTLFPGKKTFPSLANCTTLRENIGQIVCKTNVSYWYIFNMTIP